MTERDRLLEKILCDIQQHHALQDPPKNWWQNRRNNGGLMLTHTAHEWLMKHQAPYWNFEIDPAWVVPRNMLRMDRLIPVPYSLIISNRPRRCLVTIWNSAQAMTIELLGDFDRFLVALERTWQRGI